MSAISPDRVNSDPVDPAATALFHRTMPFAAQLGIAALVSTKDQVRGRLAWSEAFCTTGGVLHGGVLMALADTTGAVCAFLNLPEGCSATTTIESKTNFLRAVRSGHVTAASRPLHAGRRIIVVETEVVDDGGKLVAKVTQSQAVL